VAKKPADVLRVKLLGDWADSTQICDDWNRMSQGDLRWNDIEVTSDDTDIDFWVIINRPRRGEEFIASRTIVFQMEPWCPEPEQTWGVKTWGEWARPDLAAFLQVRTHRSHVNNAFWQLGLTYEELRDRPVTKTGVLATICSPKYFDPGHKKRVDFLHFLDEKNDDVVRVEMYAYTNPLEFECWVGPHPVGEKEAALVPYRYFIGVENNAEPNFITEKLWEPLLTETLCFYWGSPNAADHIDGRAFIPIDLDDFEGAFQTMKAAILADEWSKRIDVIRAEKTKVLEHFQFFPTLHRVLRDEFRFGARPSDEEVAHHKYFGDAVGESEPVVAFLHSLTVGGDTSIIGELLKVVESSGLLERLDRLYIVNVGDEIALPETWGQFGDKVKLINYSHDGTLGEATTIRLLQSFCREHPESKVLYLHTKGISYRDSFETIDDWRRLMTYFVVERFEDCLKELESNDAVGCNLLESPHRHFSGNFWWSNSRHIAKLEPVGVDDRHAVEWWILDAKDVSAKSMYDSGVNHYVDRYPRSLYSSDEA
jgi:hypothetical protein